MVVFLLVVKGLKTFTYSVHRFIGVPIRQFNPSHICGLLLLYKRPNLNRLTGLDKHILIHAFNCLFFRPSTPINSRSAIHAHTISLTLAAIHPAIQPSSNFIQSPTHPSLHTLTYFHISVNIYPNLSMHL